MARFRLRIVSVTSTGEEIYPDGGYALTLRLRTTYIRVNGYGLQVDNR